MESMSGFVIGSSASPGTSFLPWLFTLSLAMAGQLYATHRWASELATMSFRNLSMDSYVNTSFGKIPVPGSVLSTLYTR